MEHIDWQLRRFWEGGDRPAIIWRDRACTYSELTDRYEQWLSHLEAAGIRTGDSVGCSPTSRRARWPACWHC